MMYALGVLFKKKLTLPFILFCFQQLQKPERCILSHLTAGWRLFQVITKQIAPWTLEIIWWEMRIWNHCPKTGKWPTLTQGWSISLSKQISVFLPACLSLWWTGIFLNLNLITHSNIWKLSLVFILKYFPFKLIL